MTELIIVSMSTYNYLINAYMYTSAMYTFPKHMWARFPITIGIDTTCSTKNGCENFHKHFHIGNSHPNVFKFAKILAERQRVDLFYVKIELTCMCQRNEG